MKGNWHFLPSFVVQVVVTSLGLTEMGAGARTEESSLFIINGNGHFLPSFVVQVMRAVRSKIGVGEDAGERAGAGADAVALRHRSHVRAWRRAEGRGHRRSEVVTKNERAKKVALGTANNTL